jgi:hypothetical protein
MRKALKEAERGWETAMDKIAERANLTKQASLARY